jgi:hypothetical protein
MNAVISSENGISKKIFKMPNLIGWRFPFLYSYWLPMSGGFHYLFILWQMFLGLWFKSVFRLLVNELNCFLNVCCHPAEYRAQKVEESVHLLQVINKRNCSLQTVLWIWDILVRIRTRRSVPLTYGSGSYFFVSG